MNIWIINQYAIPLDGAGGTRHATIAKYLAQLGHHTAVFVSDPNNETIVIKNHQQFIDRDFDGYKFRYVKSPAYSNIVERFYSMLMFRRNVLRATNGLKKPDVIIGSTVHLHGADAGRRLAKRFEVPFVYEIRDIWPQTLVDIGALSTKNPVYWYLNSIENRLLRQADKIITLLPGVSEYVVSKGYDKNKVFYLPNGIDKELYPVSKTKDNDQAAFRAMFFGAHGPANGLMTLIEAAKVLADKGHKNILIELIGDGVAKPTLVKSVRDKNLNNVIFRDSLPKKEVLLRAQEADCFIFHLTDMKVLEKYGISANKLFDYLMLERPVIFACNSFNDPVKESGAGISIPPENPVLLADALIKLSQMSPADREKQGKNGKEWVIKHHDFEANVKGLESMLRSLVEN